VADPEASSEVSSLTAIGGIEQQELQPLDNGKQGPKMADSRLE
jgi:hypothetical protein